MSTYLMTFRTWLAECNLLRSSVRTNHVNTSRDKNGEGGRRDRTSARRRSVRSLGAHERSTSKGAEDMQDRRSRAGARRRWYGKRSAGTVATRKLAVCKRGIRKSKLRGDSREPARKRTVWSRKGGVHRSAHGQTRPCGKSASRDAVPG